MTLTKLIPRLMSKASRVGDCMVIAKPSTQRYWSVVYDGKRDHAHRAVFSHFKGPIPNGAVIRHSCDNPRCINPEHLQAGTQADNMHDRDQRGRNGTLGENSPLHKLTAETVREIERIAKGCDMKRCGQIGAEYGISDKTVYRIANHQTWKHLWI